MSAGARRPRSRTGAASTAAISARAPRPSQLVSSATSARRRSASRSAISACCISAWTPRSRAIPTPRPRSTSPPTTSPAAPAASRCTICSGGAVRDTIPIAHSIGLMAIEDGEREAAQGRLRGHPHHQDQGRASSRRATSRWCGGSAPPSAPDVALCVDANEGYRTPGEAIKTIRRMEAFDLDLCRAAGARHRPHGGSGARASIRR